METPRTKAARQSAIIQVISNEQVHSQAHLQALLEEQGFRVAQATISRDLFELRATKLHNRNGIPYYVFPQADQTDVMAIKNSAMGALANACADLAVSSVTKDYLLIVRTPAGGAQYLASVIDNARLEDVMGCVAGDDTILLICISERAAENLNRRLLSYGKGRGDSEE